MRGEQLVKIMTQGCENDPYANYCSRLCKTFCIGSAIIILCPLMTVKIRPILQMEMDTINTEN